MNALSTKSAPEAANLSQWLDYNRESMQLHERAHCVWPALELSNVARWAALLQATRESSERHKGYRKRKEIQTPPRIPEAHYKLASAEIRHLSSLLKQLAALRVCDETDDYGVLRASEYAYNAVCQLLIDATITAAAERREIPDGYVSTDSEGGVRIEWVRPQSSVRLVIPAAPTRQSYLYHEVGNAYATEYPTAEALAYWLRAMDERV